MTSFMEKMFAAGALIGVLLVCLNLFWSSLSSNSNYAGNYTNVDSDVNFHAMSNLSTSIASNSTSIQDSINNMQSPNLATAFLGVLSFVASTMFSILKTFLVLPITLMSIFSSSIAVLSPFINLSVFVNTLIAVFIVAGIFKILSDQGIMK